MDFPISVPSIGLVDGKFVDEDPLGGAPGSLIPAQWGNGITQEVLNVIEAAGLVPDEMNNAQLLAAISLLGRQPVLLTDTGIAGAYTAANVPALTELPTTGFVQRVKIANPNPGASTYAPDGLAPKPIYGLGLQPLQGGELPAGVAVLMYLVQAGVNGGNGAWIIIESLGGASQVAPATKTQHAVQFGQLGQVGHGQCRLNYVSATSIKLSPLNGNNLIINGLPRQIPAAGVTLSNEGLSASTNYFVYAYWTGSAIALVASTTGHSQDATTGIEIKTGDATRALVGMVFTNPSSQFADAPAERHVASWFNRRAVGGVLSRNNQTNFTVGTAAEVSTADRVSFLNWADEVVDVRATGQYFNGSPSTSVLAQSYVDGTPHGNLSASYEATSNGGMTFTSMSSFPISGVALAEGRHIAQVFGSVTGGAGAITYLANSIVTRI